MVETLRNAGASVAGLIAIFDYGFETAAKNFSSANCKYYTLTNYESLIQLAVQRGYVEPSQLESLKKWRKDPANWGN